MESSIGLFYQITVKDKNGKVVRKTRFRRSESITIAFLQILSALIDPLTAASTRDITNALHGVTDDAQDFNIDAAPATQGIQVGTGTTTPTNLDYVIETPIANGAGAGQLNYGSNGFIPAGEVGANVDFIINRSFSNASGGTINVTETGIYAQGYYPSTAGIFMIARDVFTAVPVANTETITVTYTLRTTV